MAVTWTEEQKKVITLRNRNILVSAAAGSGKTAVLVQRILEKIMDPEHPVDIDRLLIMTFTRAAAGEMKERLTRAIEQALYEDPENEHLQHQMTLIHTAQITTIDGFCSWLIKNYFYMIDLDPGYRVLDEGEGRLLREDVLKDLLEALYAEADPDFLHFSECYAPGKTDDSLKDYLLQVYFAAMSHPFPTKWLDQALESFRYASIEELREAPWLLRFWRAVEEELSEAKSLVEEALKICESPGGHDIYREALQEDFLFLKKLEQLAGEKNYQAVYELLGAYSFARLSVARKKEIEPSLKEAAKTLRDEEKEVIKGLKSSFFFGPEEQMLEILHCCAGPMQTLVRITGRFIELFSARKREKNLVDFTDLEHFALKILLQNPEVPQETMTEKHVQQSESGKKNISEESGFYMSDAARELSEKYDEVLVDEYQDSNLVQELLTTCVSGWVKDKKNIFMVGDVKQSIYRFRLARPELFQEKYNTYSLEDSREQRIDLHKNFRSRPEVLHFVNFLFRQLMGEDLGGINYDAAAALNPGAVFPPRDSESFARPEVLLVEKDSEDLEDTDAAQNDRELEALAVGQRILEIVGKEQVLDKETGTYRPAEFGDIVVLLRTSSGWAESFSQVFESLGIPGYTASRTGYFSAVEVVTILNYLRICDNPLQDIPLAGVLRSPMVGLSVQELAIIRTACPEGLLYDALQVYLSDEQSSQETEGQAVQTEAPGEETVSTQQKLAHFLSDLEQIRDLAEYTPIHELIRLILQRTGYGTFVRALPGGAQRSANLRMLIEKAMEFEKTSYHGLFHFVRYVENLQKYEVDFGEVSLADAGKGAVQIMTVHKSKGLEFPIVFVSGMGKQFNFQDIYAKLLIHSDLGLGTDAIFPEKRMMVSSLHKQVIRRELLRDQLGEELRVLYVALTRAKEKLIVTGTISKLEKTLRRFARFTESKKELLPVSVRMQAKCYWDDILPALLRHPCMDELLLSYGILPSEHLSGGENLDCLVRVIRPKEMAKKALKQQVNTSLREDILKNWDADRVYEPSVRELLKERFSYQYPYEELSDIPVKVSVSELKKRSYSDSEEKESSLYLERDIIPLVPHFISSYNPESQMPINVNTGAFRGTAYHRVMECLDYHRVSDAPEIQKQITELYDQQKLTREEAACVIPEDILAFLQTPLGERMRRAGLCGHLFREQPFVIARQASLLDQRWPKEASVLIQGIIDAYFLEGEDIILVDYKTDKVTDKTGKHLVELYHVQLEDYADALERLTGRKVREKYLYSFTLGKEIAVGA